MPTSLFVYGTLMPGRLRWGLLREVAVSSRPDTVPGWLYDTGEGWPAARFHQPLDTAPLEGAMDAAGAASEIPGWVVAVHADSVAALLPVLDEVETGFRRVRVRTDGGLEAWGYEVVERQAWWPTIPRWEAREER